MKKLLALTAIAAVSFTPSAQAFDIGDAIMIIETVGGMTRDRGPREVDSAPSIEDIDLECRLRGFDGWYEDKCQNFRD
jgi:hypothetical protein